MSGLIEYLRNLRKATKPGAEDASDRLNFVWSPVVLLLCSLIVFGKEYISKPMHCIFTPNTMQGHARFEDFAESYCWAHGTYAYSKQVAIQLTGYKDQESQEKYWQSLSGQLQSYYQWVPFLLLLQCVLTYMPKLLWQVICSQRFGSDIYGLICLASEAKISDEASFSRQAARIADVVERMLMYNREYRNGRLQRLKSALYNRCSFLLPSKRMGTMLTLLYICVKLLSLANVIGQLALMAIFLGFWRRGIVLYGWTMVQHLVAGRGWQDTMLFPLRTLCYVTAFDPVDGATNAYIGQCTLPVNILNEKIFIVLFFWFLLVGAITVLSIVRWLSRLLCTCNRVIFVKRFLRLSDPHAPADKATVKSFISGFLRHDGVFLVLMLSEGSDKVITTEVVRLLYRRWRDKHHGCDLRRGCDCSCGTTLPARGGAILEQLQQQQNGLPRFDLDDVAQKTLPCASTAVDESGMLSV